MFRHLVIDNVNITNTIDMTADNFYVGIYLQYPTENVSIKNVNLKNSNNASSFNYKDSIYNSVYFAIRAFQPNAVFDVENVVVDSATAVVLVDNISASAIDLGGVTVKNLKVIYFRDVVLINNVNAIGEGDVAVEDVGFYESSTIYGRAIVTVLASTNRLRKLMIRGLHEIPVYAKTVHLEDNAGCPIYSYIDTAGFDRRLASLNTLPANGTITQNDYLVRGDFAIWGHTSSITLSTTVPIQRPVTRGNIFAIFNYSAVESLTIPGNSNTVDNVANIVIAPGETHYFMADSAGTKWTRYKIETGNSLL